MLLLLLHQGLASSYCSHYKNQSTFAHSCEWWTKYGERFLYFHCCLLSVYIFNLDFGVWSICRHLSLFLSLEAALGLERLWKLCPQMCITLLLLSIPPVFTFCPSVVCDVTSVNTGNTKICHGTHKIKNKELHVDTKTQILHKHVNTHKC